MGGPGMQQPFGRGGPGFGGGPDGGWGGGGNNNNDDPFNNVVMVGDAATLFGYGVIQNGVDAILEPLAVANPGAFTNDLPVDSPIAQASFIALLWVLLGRYSGSYKVYYNQRRSLPDALLACVYPWLGTSALLLGALSVAKSTGLGPGASQGEIDFVMGSITVVGAWRLICLRMMP